MRHINPGTEVTMSTRRNFVNYAYMTLRDGTRLTLTPSDFRISGNGFTDDWCEGDAFQLGSTIGKTATITLDNSDNRVEIIDGQEVTYYHGKFSEYDFDMAYFMLDMVLPSAYTDASNVVRDEIIRIGEFTVTTPVSRGSVIEMTGVDNMYRFDKSFDDCTLDFSTGVSLLTVLNRCCNDCKVVIGYTNFNNSNLVVREKPEGVTYRQVVSYIAQIAGCNAVIGDTGALQLKWYDMSVLDDNWLDGGTFGTKTTPYSDGDTADGGSFNPWTVGDVWDGGDFTTPLQFHNLTAINSTQVNTDDIVFTGVLVSYDEVSAHYPVEEGWDTYCMTISDNPFVAGYESQIAQFLYSQLADLRFRPFSTSAIQNPTIEAGDCALVYDVKGNMYKTIITNVSYKVGGYTEVKAVAESPISQNSSYVNPAAQATTVAKKKVTEYSAQVAHFNKLANDALGYYQTNIFDQSTGSTITYVHDKSTLAASKIVWKITSAGYFVTENYTGNDETTNWNTGYDASTGTMLVNLLYAHGISCDWITAGTLTLGGNNNVSGRIQMLDANSKEYGKWDSSEFKIGKNFTISTDGNITAKGGTIAGFAFGEDYFGTHTGNFYSVIKKGEFSFGSESNNVYTRIDYKSKDDKGNGRLIFDYSNTDGGIYVKNRGDNDPWGGHWGNHLVLHNHTVRKWVEGEGNYYPYWTPNENLSDSRLKNSIDNIPVEDIECLFNNIRPVSFKYNDDTGITGTYYGLIAQELQSVLENLGYSDNRIVRKTQAHFDLEEYLMIDYPELTGFELAGIKHLYEKLRFQEQEILSLKNEINELKNIVNSMNK